MPTCPHPRAFLCVYSSAKHVVGPSAVPLEQSYLNMVYVESIGGTIRDDLLTYAPAPIELVSSTRSLLHPAPDQLS